MNAHLPKEFIEQWSGKDSVTTFLGLRIERYTKEELECIIRCLVSNIMETYDMIGWKVK